MRSRAPALRRLLSHSDTATAANSAFALGLLKDTASTDELVTALRASPVVAVEAAWALGEIGARESIEHTLFGFTESAAPVDGAAAGHNPQVVTAVLLAAAKLRPVPWERIQLFLGMPDDSISWAASYAVSRNRVPAATRALIGLANASSALVRANVARGLAMAAAGDSLAEQAATVLTTLAADRDAQVRINAVRSLASYGPRHMPAVFRLMRDPDANVRIAATQSLPAVPAGIHDSTWLAAWAADTSLAFRQGLLAASTRIRYLLPGVTEWRSSPDWRMRTAVADAAAASRHPWLIDSLVTPMLRDPDVRVRARAYGALGAAMDSIPGVADRVRAALDDPEADVRAAALEILADGAGPSAAGVPRTLDAYARAKRDTSNVARVAALGYVAAAWRRDSVRFDDALRARLAAMAAPADPEERQRVADVPLFGHWKKEAGTPRPAEWYQNRYRELVRRTRAGRATLADIVTERGTISVSLFGADAPLTVENFVTLARSGYYRDVRFHRVVPNFVAQAGDPTGTGSGGPGYAIRDELNRRRYRRGALGMALSGPDTGGSQWFITHSPQPHLDGGYTVFGQVISGWDALDSLVQGDRILRITVR